MLCFSPDTPEKARDILERLAERLDALPGDVTESALAIVTRFARDERMAGVWKATRNWSEDEIESLLRSAILLQLPSYCWDLTREPTQRFAVGLPHAGAAAAFEIFASSIEQDRDLIAPLWHGRISIDEMLALLRSHADRLNEEAARQRADVADAPFVHSQGSHEPGRRNYELALVHRIQKIRGQPHYEIARFVAAVALGARTETQVDTLRKGRATGKGQR
jgi:hypothetical protein